MNILMLTSSDTGGVFGHILTVSKEITRRNNGNSVFIGCEHQDKICKYEEICPTYELDFHSKNPLKMIETLRQLSHIIETRKIDIVHCHYRTAALYMQLLNIMKPVSYVWTNHLVPIPYDFLHRMLTFYGKKAISIGTDSKNFLVNDLKIPEKDIEVVFHGVTIENHSAEAGKSTLREKYNISEKEKVIVLLGRLTEVKGHKFLLDAIYDLPGIKILFTGDGNEEYKKDLIQKSRQLGIESKVVYTGFVNPYEILQIADVMVLPSRQEGFPLSILESFSMKVPVVRTKTGGYEDMKDLCLAVDFDDSASLKDCVQKVLAGGSEIENMTNRAYGKILSDWNTEAMVDHLLEVYDKCRSGNRKY